tara:strand:- start:45 stop:593 length:549 start_codon:yes stop_codon:yes gene_type:complete
MTNGVMHVMDKTSGKARPLTLETTAGVLSVDNSGNTQPVSGTFYQATQPVSLASSVAVTGTFYQATQPISIAGTVTTSGTLAISKTKGGLSNATSVSANDFSSSHDITNYNKLAIAGTHTGSGQIELWISDDDSNYFKAAEHDIYPDGDNDFYKLLPDAPFKYYKLKYKASGTVTAAGFAST